MTTLCVATTTVTAQEQVIDEETLEKRIAEIYPNYGSLEMFNANVRERVLEGGVSPEWVTVVLENQIRKYLPELAERLEKERYRIGGLSDVCRDLGMRVTRPVIVLREFPGPDTLALIQECTFSKDSIVFDYAVDTYVSIAGGDSVPFLRELAARGGGGRSGRLSSNLRTFFSAYEKNNRTDDAAKLHAFLLELLQTGDDWGDVHSLDRVLCDTLDGYAKSVQRAQAIQRFSEKMQKTNNTDDQERHRKVQADVEKTPVKERKDFRAKGELLDPDRLKAMDERKRE